MKKSLLVVLLMMCSLFQFGQNTSDLDPYIVTRFIDSTGQEVVGVMVPGRPPDNFRMPEATITRSAVTLPDVPAFDWCFGCSATSVAMMAGYYDRTGYADVYTGPTNGGVVPMNNSVWGSVIINGETRSLCPLSATRNGLDGRTTRGHADDYWIQYGSTAQDPYITNGWTQHTYGDCTGDYMKTNQSEYGNVDGSTLFYYYPSGSPYNGHGNNNDDGIYGARLFFESRGYTVLSSYNQLIWGHNGNASGFTFAQYKQEINANRPVLIQVSGHTMLGVGYDDSNNDSIVYLHDTWDYSTHQMTWGSSYSGMQQYMVSVLKLGCATEPEQPDSISGLTIVCENTMNVYSVPEVEGATSYTWTLPSGWSGSSSIHSINATAGPTSGVISVTANNACGSSVAQTLTVTVNPASVAPTGASASSDTLCSGQTTTITVDGGSLGTGAGWMWYADSCGGIYAGAGSSLTVAPAVTTSYFVRAEGTCDTTACASVTITVNINSVAPASITPTSSSICTGGTTTLAVSGGSLGTSDEWVWYADNCGGTLVGTGSSVTVSPAATTAYYVRAEGPCDTTDCASVTVVVNPLPEAVATSNSPVYRGSNIELHGLPNSMSQYSWSGPDGFTSNLQNPVITNAQLDQTGDYILTVTDATNCSAADTVQVIVKYGLGIDPDRGSHSMTLYPNPVHQMLIIELPAATKIEVYNVFGQVIMESASALKHELNMSACPAGVYFIHAGDSVSKVVKQ